MNKIKTWDTTVKTENDKMVKLKKYEYEIAIKGKINNIKKGHLASRPLHFFA